MMAPAIIFFILLLVAFQYGPIPADPGPFWGPIILIMFVSSVLGLMVFAVGSLVSPYERRLKGEVDERQWPSEKTRSRIEKWLDEWL